MNKMHSSTSIKGSSPSSSTKPSSSSTPPVFSGTTLEQVLQFVLPEDVARATMVCKTWRDDLKKPLAPTMTKKTGDADDDDAAPSASVMMNSMAIWKQTVTNSNPNVIQAVIVNCAVRLTKGWSPGAKRLLWARQTSPGAKRLLWARQTSSHAGMTVIKLVSQSSLRGHFNHEWSKALRSFRVTAAHSLCQ
jgi:hypothetical protein